MAEKKAHKKASIIDILMVILIVGIVVILVFPALDTKRKKEIIAQEVLPTFNLILEKNEGFYKEYNYYAMIDQLNIKELKDKEYFEYDLTDSTVTATSTTEFGKPGAIIVYNFLDNSWSVQGEEGVIQESWLP